MATSAIRASVWTAAAVAAMVCGAVGFSRAAMAQPADVSAPAESQDITVSAPEVVRMQASPPRMQQRRRRPVEVVMTSQQVSFADLDLAKPADVATLRHRITDAARDACRRLANSAPAHRTSAAPPGCEATASMQAMAIANQLATAARSD